MPFKEVKIGKYTFRHSPDRTVVSSMEDGSSVELTNIDKIWQAHRGTCYILRGTWDKCCNFDKCGNLVYVCKSTINRRSRVSCSKECGYSKIDPKNLKKKTKGISSYVHNEFELDFLEIKILKSGIFDLSTLYKEFNGESPKQIQVRVLSSIPMKFKVSTIEEARSLYLSESLGDKNGIK